MVNNSDPAKAAMNAVIHIIMVKGQFIATLFRYCLAAKNVPLKEGILIEPITVDTGISGNSISAAGV